MRFLVLMAEEDHFDKWEATTEQEQQAFFDGLAAFTAAVRERGRSCSVRRSTGRSAP